MANPTSLTAGQTYRWTITTGATGLRTATYGSMFESEGGASLQITQTGSKNDMIVGTVSSDGTSLFCTIEKDFT
jgi:hypothetical protein